MYICVNGNTVILLFHIRNPLDHATKFSARFDADATRYRDHGQHFITSAWLQQLELLDSQNRRHE